MIDPSTINRILDAADIVDVVKEFVTLRKSGANYKGLCPFHDEKTPSFTVSPSKQLCKCFSCGKGGNVVHFVMEHEQMTYPEALRWLGKKYGIEVQERELSDEERISASTRESMFVLNEWARDYFVDTLHHHVDGVSIGMGYFRQRGFRDDIIKKFQLGYCPSTRDAMAKTAIAQGYQAEYLEKTGLCYRTDDNRLVDRYWGRVIFPVHTISGKVVAFGGRILSSEKKLAKYVNSPESEIYSKSRELYGLYQAKHAIVKHNRCFLVEGYTDVISMHQCGIENVVASSGTSLTEGQIRLIHRFTNNITVLYDGDAAGIKASLRGIDMLLAEGLNVKVLLLPDGDDPDSFARKHNATDFQAYIEQHQVDFIKFKIQLLMNDTHDDPIRRAELVQDIVRSISVIPDKIVRNVYVKESSTLLDVDEALIVNEIAKAHRAKTNTSSVKENNDAAAKEAEETEATQLLSNEIVSKQAKINHEEWALLQLIIRYGAMPLFNMPNENGEAQTISVAAFILSDMQNDSLSFSSPCHRQILHEAAALPCHPNPQSSLNHFLSHQNIEISRMAAEMGVDKHVLSKSQQQGFTPDVNRLNELAPRLLYDFKSGIVRNELIYILEQLKQPDIYSQPEKYKALMQRYKELSTIEQQLSQIRGDRVVNSISLTRHHHK